MAFLGLKDDEVMFIAGVVNVIFSSWLIGAYPYCFWVWHMAKMGFLLVRRFIRFSELKRAYFLFDYCYIINYTLFAYYFVSFFRGGIASFRDDKTFADWGPHVFRILFTACVGPLAMSIAMFRNSLVFHNIEQVTILALHWSPNLAMWGMRWFPNQLSETFPGVFDLGCGEPNALAEYALNYSTQNCEGTFVQLWCWPVVHYVALYAIPYFLFFFVLGADYLERNGHMTMLEDMKKQPGTKEILENIGGPLWYQGGRYMLLHGGAAMTAFFLGPLFWHSFSLHTIYLGCLMIIAVKNGATYYFRVFSKILMKQAAEKKEVEAVPMLNEDKEQDNKLVDATLSA